MAAQTGILNASIFKLYLTISETERAVAHSTNVSISVSQEMMAATSKDSNGWDESLPGKKSWTASGDFYHDQVTSGKHNLANIFSSLTAGSKLACTFKLDSQQVDDRYFTGNVYIESIDVNAGVEDNISYSISLKGTGALSFTAYNVE